MRSSQVTTQIPQIGMQQFKYKKSFKFLLSGIASLMTVTGFAVLPASAELSRVGPINDTVVQREDGKVGIIDKYGGFPRWYEDTTPANTTRSKPLRLDLCLEASIDRGGFCLTEPPDPMKPNFVSDEEALDSNFPDEAFWWTAEAQIDQTVNINGRRGTIQGLLVLATEAAFANEDVINADQMAFNRTRIRIQGTYLENNRKYRIVYPYGVKILTATRKDPRKPSSPVMIRFNEDFGCAVAVSTCNFTDLTSKSASRGRILNDIGRPWLTWDSDLPVVDANGEEYIGDPNTEHTVTGSPRIDETNKPQNYFKIQRVNNDGSFTTIAEQTLFSVSGKVSTDTSP